MTSLVTAQGLNWMLEKCFSSTTEVAPTIWEIGIDNTPPSEADTSCLGRVPHTYTVVEACDAIAGWTQGGDGVAPVLNTVGENEGTGCLDIRATFNTGTATWEKIVAGFNLTTNNRDFYVFFFVDDKTILSGASSDIKIVLGTGGFVDYNEYYFDSDDLNEGEWNVLRIPDPSSPDATGGTGADLTDIDRFKIELTITKTYSSDEIRLDAWHWANEADHEKATDASYPVINTSLHQITHKVTYAPGEANGYKLQRVFFENVTDYGFNSGTFSYIDKNASKEFSITTLLKVKNA